MQAIRIHQTGGPEQLVVDEVPIPEPKPDQALVKVAVSGINFIDCYHRSGLYPLPLPATPGVEGAGTVVAVGTQIRDLQPGARVAWVGPTGAYAEYVCVPADRLVLIPTELDFQQAAAVLLQGMTAYCLCHDVYHVRPSDVVLIHAAAGGVGRLLVQMCKQLQACVIGTAGSEEKAALARAAGADEVILYRQQDFVAKLREYTAGAGAHVVYDSVGQATFAGSLELLRPCGYLVSFGQSSGPVPAVELRQLAAKSLFLTRPSLFHYIADRAALQAYAQAVFALCQQGLDVRIDRVLPLVEATQAHRLLEGRQTAGKLLLKPNG